MWIISHIILLLVATVPTRYDPPPSYQNEGHELTVRKVQSKVLQPVMSFPIGSRVMAVSVLADKASWHVGYLVATPLSWSKTCDYYRRKYANDKVKWYGEIGTPLNGPYSFVVMNMHDRKAVNFVVLVHRKLPDEWHARVNATEAERREPWIETHVEVADKNQRIKMEEDSLVIPIPR